MTSISSTAKRCAGLLSWRAAAVAGLVLVSTACSGLDQAMTAHTDLVARAAGQELRVEEASEILAANPQIPPDSEVVRALAELWVDYALLSAAVAEDSTLAALDLTRFIDPVREQALVLMLREQVVSVDTIFDDAEIERRWATEGPSAEISARHILLRVPPEATDVQRDSVEQFAESLRQRAIAGESFAELAGEHSQDPGSAARGGDLGFFSRGRMVEPFEEAAFALDIGEVSEVVESPFGYHIIVVEERRQQEMGEEREAFRQFLVQRTIQEAELAYLDSLADDVNVTIPTATLDVAREIASRPERSLSGRQGARAIATYDGGEYTASEFGEFVRSQPPQMQSSFASASDEQLETAIRQLVQMELLLAEVEARGITLPAEEDDRLRREAREMLDDLLQATGFVEAARQGAGAGALADHVKQLVEGVVTGEAPFVPLGQLGLILRDRYTYEVNESAFSSVISGLEQIRASQPAPPAPLPLDPEGMPLEAIPGGEVEPPVPGQP